MPTSTCASSTACISRDARRLGGDRVRARQVFRIRGGSRIAAGNATGQVQVKRVDGHRSDAPLAARRAGRRLLHLHARARLGREPHRSVLQRDRLQVPPRLLHERLRAAAARPAAVAGPAIDYLAKDYDSFRHTLMVAMAERVPGWASTSEADHDQVLIDLFAAAADELSDYQDRVMSEATSRRRASASRWRATPGSSTTTCTKATRPARGWRSRWWAARRRSRSPTGTGGVDRRRSGRQPRRCFFASRQRRLPPAQRQRLDPLLNRLRLHTWRNAQPALGAGSTSADIAPLAGLRVAGRGRRAARPGAQRPAGGRC